MTQKAKVTEFYANLGYEGPSHTETITLERFRNLYGDFLLSQLLKNGYAGDCIGQDRGMQAQLVEG